MTIYAALNWFAIAITLAFGIFSFVAPKKSAASVFFTLNSSRAIAEYRIGFGGMLIGICGWIIYSNEPAAINALGFIWAGAAIARAASYFIDSPKPHNFFLAALVFEVVMAACLFV
jgi:Domain of unknown function (DUF4345)